MKCESNLYGSIDIACEIFTGAGLAMVMLLPPSPPEPSSPSLFPALFLFFDFASPVARNPNRSRSTYSRTSHSFSGSGCITFLFPDPMLFKASRSASFHPNSLCPVSSNEYLSAYLETIVYTLPFMWIFLSCCTFPPID